MNSLEPLSPELERLARRRVRALLGLYLHALIYVIVIGGLSLLSLSQGKSWSVWPAAGWGIGLLLHGVGVIAFGPGGRLGARLLDRERERLRRTPQA